MIDKNLILKYHGQLDPLFLHVHTENFYFYYISYTHYIQWVFHKLFVRQFGNVHQSILMDTYIYKGTKINDITDGSL